MKTFIKQIRSLLPNYIKTRINKQIMNKKLKNHKSRKERIFITLNEIEVVLNKLNFNTDILIHSSTSNIGKIEGGAKKITELIISKINLSENTLLAPALPFNGPMKDYLDSCSIFELDKAKNAMGNISNMIMKNEQSLRSFHPTHSVIALGKKSNYYTLNHELGNTPFGFESPYAKITRNNGKILMFGVNLNSVTNFHVYEDLILEYLPFNVYITNKIYKIKASKNTNEQTTINVSVHNPLLSAKRDCERARKYLVANNYIQSYKIGDSEISLLDAKGLTITLLEMLLINDSIYGKITKLTIDQIEQIKLKIKELK